MKLEEGIQLIMRFEAAGTEANYLQLHIERPTWPGGQSGVTIGIGYDLGYHSASKIRTDWSGHLGAQTVERLTPCAGVTGQAAKSRVSELNDIVVPWSAAISVFRESSIPDYLDLTSEAFPGVDKVHPRCHGALLSLVFNRGKRMTDPPGRPGQRKEMRAIRELVPNKAYEQIAQEIRSMKRLWIGTINEKGLSRRRDAEADLVLMSLSDH
jgi:GH24 family phage-related lysozyme (muramidase)